MGPGADVSGTRDDCHQPLLQAITTLIVKRAKAGLITKIMKVKSHIGIHGKEMADKLANEAAEECTKARHFDRDVSQEYCEPFKDKFWIQHEIQVPTTTGISTKTESLRDLHSSLSQKVHAKYKLGCSNQDSVYFQLWKNIQPYRYQNHSDKFCTMKCFMKDPRSDKLVRFAMNTPHARCKLCRLANSFRGVRFTQWSPSSNDTISQ